MVQRFLLSLRRTGGLLSSAAAISAAKALITRNSQYNLSHIHLDSSHWAQSMFRRMGFKKRMRTTGKVEIPEGARKEAELLYLHNIVTIVEKYETPHSLIMNLDQTLLKYIPAMNHTMAKQNFKSVSIAGSSNKRSVTGTFTITLNDHFLPIDAVDLWGESQPRPQSNLKKIFRFPLIAKRCAGNEVGWKVSLGLSFPMVSR